VTAELGDETSATGATAFLRSPAPNPVTSRTTMRFGVPRETNVSLRVFDAAGRVVRDLHNGSMGAGEYASTWDLSRTTAAASRGASTSSASHSATRSSAARSSSAADDPPAQPGPARSVARARSVPEFPLRPGV